MAASSAPIIHFTPAIREGSRVLIIIYGDSSAGKTFSALLLARGLVGPTGKIIAVDTENRRMKVYADEPEIGGFHHGELTPPFSPERYGDAVDAAALAGADCIVLDSMSHEWNDVGGVIALSDIEEDKGKKGLQKWRDPKTRHKRFVQRFLRVNCHIIGCMRAKEKFKEEIVKRGNEEKKQLVSAGFFPEQDQRLKFEATIQMRLGADRPGFPIIEKIPRGLAHVFAPDAQITVAHGEAIAKWVHTGKPVDLTLEELKTRAQTAAESGMRALEGFWKTLPSSQQKALEPFKPNYKSVAATHDEQGTKGAA